PQPRRREDGIIPGTAFTVCRRRQLGDLKCPEPLAIKPFAVLRKAEQPTLDFNHPPPRPSRGGAAADHRARRVLPPRPEQLVRIKQAECVVAFGLIRFDKEPPPSVTAEEGGIAEATED